MKYREMKSLYVVTDIDWDVDCAKDIESLPEEISIPSELTAEDTDSVSDYITELTGFCHKGFRLRRRFT